MNTSWSGLIVLFSNGRKSYANKNPRVSPVLGANTLPMPSYILFLCFISGVGKEHTPALSLESHYRHCMGLYM